MFRKRELHTFGDHIDAFVTDIKIFFVVVFLVGVAGFTYAAIKEEQGKQYETACQVLGGQVYTKKDSSHPVCLKDDIELKVTTND